MKTRILASEQSEQQAKLASHKLVYRRNYEPILTLSVAPVQFAQAHLGALCLVLRILQSNSRVGAHLALGHASVREQSSKTPNLVVLAISTSTFTTRSFLYKYFHYKPILCVGSLVFNLVIPSVEL